MGRTIPSFRIAAVLEEKEWKLYRKYLRNKAEKKIFDNMFSIANLYNSASSNAVIPIRIHPIMILIIFHHCKMITKKLFTRSIGDIKNSDDKNYDDDINDNNNDNTNFIILKLGIR
jgi:hypothetical protein